MPFTPEELAEMARADAEIEESFCMTADDLRVSRKIDREARMSGMDNAKRKIAEQQRAYYEANRDKIAEQKRAYREANRDKINGYMREYMRAYRERKRDAAAHR